MISFDSFDAQQIVDAHEIDALLANEEEVTLLEEHNPDLLNAYERLLIFARSSRR